MAAEIGDTAPDFTLKDQDGQDITLSKFRGSKNVLLVFYPLAFTGTCQGELCSISDELPAFVNDKVQVLTVSVDSPFTHKAWAEREGFEFPLLADFWPHGAVATGYGVLNDVTGFANRATFLIDTEGVVRWRVVNGPGEARDQKQYHEALDSIGVSA